MKKLLVWLLLAATMLSLCSCSAKEEPTQPPQAPAATLAPEETTVTTEVSVQTEPVISETEPVIPEETAPAFSKSIFLKVSAITFSVVGESEDIYLGLIPRELVTWESEDPSVVSVENGVLTAVGVGTTTVHATYEDLRVSVSTGCLAETQEELESLSFEVLNQPKRLPPEVDMSAPCTCFDNCTIVGDSISYMMLQEESKGDYLGNMLFLARGGTSLNGFVRRFKNVYFQGREMNLEDAIAASGVKRMYILIGSNDIGSDPQRAVFIENWGIIVDRIKEKSPEVEIVIISNIPQSAPTEYEAKQSHFITYNDRIREYNDKLEQFAGENGCMYLDLHYYIQDHCNRMPTAYHLDGFHPNATGYMNIMKVLRYYAQYELEGGTA